MPERDKVKSDHGLSAEEYKRLQEWFELRVKGNAPSAGRFFEAGDLLCHLAYLLEETWLKTCQTDVEHGLQRLAQENEGRPAPLRSTV